MYEIKRRRSGQDRIFFVNRAAASEEVHAFLLEMEYQLTHAFQFRHIDPCFVICGVTAGNEAEEFHERRTLGARRNQLLCCELFCLHLVQGSNPGSFRFTLMYATHRKFMEPQSMLKSRP